MYDVKRYSLSENLNNNQAYIENAKNGDQKAFSYLLNTYWNDVYSFQLLRTRDENEAEDITIRTFSKAFDKIKTYKAQYEFKTWLITISKNIHIDLIRQKKPEFARKLSKQDKNSVYNLADDRPTYEYKLITEQNLDSLLQDLKKLKPHYQKVLHLRYFQELSYDEIAKELNEPLNNVKVKLLRAKRLLAEIIHQPKNKNF